MAVSANGPAQLMTAEAPANARSRAAGSSTDASRTSNSAYIRCNASSLARFRPERIALHPRLCNSETTKRPVCPYAPKTVIIRPDSIQEDSNHRESNDRKDANSSHRQESVSRMRAGVCYQDL